MENTCLHDSNVSCSEDADCLAGGACEPDECGGPSSYCFAVLASFEGQVRWLGPPSVFDDNNASMLKFVASELQCTPHFRDWSPPALTAEVGAGVDTDSVFFYGAEVVPCSTYEAQQATRVCVDALSEACFSEALEIRTALWGDVWPSIGIVSFNDMGAAVRAFRSIPFVAGDNGSAPNKWRAMLRGNSILLNRLISFSDIGRTVEAFKSIGYAERGPTDCP